MSELDNSDTFPRPTTRFGRKSTLTLVYAGVLFQCCLGPRGRLSDLSVSLSKSILYRGFVWVHRALNSQKRRFPARAVAVWLIPAGKVCVGGLCVDDSFYLVLPACSISAFMGGWSVGDLYEILCYFIQDQGCRQ